MGLSPRVWGSPLAPCCDFVAVRSIPTCVGQPITPNPWASLDAVYPHVCGAAGAGQLFPAEVNGLSPRVWGSLSVSSGKRGIYRSIPTCVGQPGIALASPAGAAVYPHVCGAAQSCYLAALNRMGLSPRVWGSLRLLIVSPVSVRSIPTCVGQPWGTASCCLH